MPKAVSTQFLGAWNKKKCLYDIALYTTGRIFNFVPAGKEKANVYFSQNKIFPKWGLAWKSVFL